MSTEDTTNTMFSPAEVDYLKSQSLCRLATVGADSQPHVTPVAFRFNADTNTFDISGHGGFAKREKWRDVEQNPHVALVIDDIASVNPWRARGIEILGDVELHQTGGETVIPGADPQMFHITPKRIISWGLDTDAYGRPNSRAVNQS